MGGPPRITLREIAAEAGVSLTTISKVLNGAPDVATATRARVEERLRARGYRRRGGHGRREYIEIVLPQLRGEDTLALIEGVLAVAGEAGMTVSLAVSGDASGPAAEWTDAALRRRPAGIVVLASGLPAGAPEVLARAAVPVVLIDPAGDPAAGLPAVGAANWAGGLAATRHLIDLGHRRIAALMGPASTMTAVARMDGYRAALSAAALRAPADWERFGPADPADAGRAATAMLSGGTVPTAIIAGSDAQAAGVLRAARAIGVGVPESLSVVGFGDPGGSDLREPALTTVRLPLREMAETAARLLLHPAAPGSAQPVRVELATSLVVRASTAPPPEDDAADGAGGAHPA